MRLFLGSLLVALGQHAEPPAIVWSPTDHSALISIDGAATRTDLAAGAFQSCRSDTGQSNGVRTVIFDILSVGSGEGTGPGMMIGVGNGQAPLNNYVGADDHGVSYDSRGRTVKGALGTSTPPPYTTGDVIAMQVDLDAHTVRFSKNGGPYSAATDIASLGPEVYVTCSLGNGSTRASVRLGVDNWNDFSRPTVNVVAHGDSITLTGGVRETYHPRLLRLIKATRVGWAEGRHFGINGVTWQFAWSGSGYAHSLMEDALVRVDAARSADIPNWLIAFAGTNGLALFNDTPARQYASLQTYISARIAAGWNPAQIIVPTMLPRSGVSEVDRTNYNAAILADSGRLGYKVARLDLDPDIGAAGQNTNTLWFLDGTHPTDAGHDVIARILYGVMFPQSRRQQ